MMKYLQQFCLLTSVLFLLIGCADRDETPPVSATPVLIATTSSLPTAISEPTIVPTSTPDWEDVNLFSIDERRFLAADNQTEAVIIFSQPTTQEAGNNNYSRLVVVTGDKTELVGERWEIAALGGTQFTVHGWSADAKTLYFQLAGVGHGCPLPDNVKQLQRFDVASGEVSDAPFVGLPNPAETKFATLDDSNALILIDTTTKQEERISFPVPDTAWGAGQLKWLDNETLTFVVVEDAPCPHPVFAEYKIDATTNTLIIPPTATPTPSPTPTMTPTPTPDPLGFVESACAFDVDEVNRDVRCGVLTVPENRDDPANQNRVKLPVAVFASPSNRPVNDALVYLTGGPGGSALFAANQVFEQQYGQLLEDRDLVLFDQRGTGYAEPSLACPELDGEMIFIMDDSQSLVLDMVTQCRDRLIAQGVDLDAYSSAESAADVADLRVALGYDEWNLLGISYGTRLAQTIMRDHPTGIRSVVLDSTVPIEAALMSEAPLNAVRAFESVFQECEASAQCVQQFENGMSNALNQLVDELNERPLPVNVFYDGKLIDVSLTGEMLMELLFDLLYEAQPSGKITALITAIKNGGTSQISRIISNNLTMFQGFSLGMHWSVNCAEERSFEPENRAAVIEPNFLTDFLKESVTLGELNQKICNIWDVDAAPAIENQPVDSEIPTLVLAGYYDPITPPTWGRQVADHLPNSTYLEFAEASHGVYIQACGLASLFAFLDDPTDFVEPRCVQQETTNVVAQDEDGIEMVSAELPSFDLTTLVPLGWAEILPGVYARQETELDEAVLMQQSFAGADQDAFITQLLGDLNIELGEPIGELATEQTSWTQYQTFVVGSVVDVAIGNINSQLIGVVLLSNPAERDALYEQVMRPILQQIN